MLRSFFAGEAGEESDQMTQNKSAQIPEIQEVQGEFPATVRT